MRGAGEILALADEAMNRLHSAVEESTETSSGVVLRSRTEYQAPDRMHRRSDGQEEIVIDSTRYLHHDGTMWHPQPSQPFRWPVSALADGARDVVLLGTETLSGQECLVIQFVDSSSGSHHRIWIAPRDGV